MRESKDVRLFFALWPDDEVRVQIAANLDRINIDRNKCRLLANSNLHLTLHFVGNTSFAAMKCLDRQASEFDAEPFDLTLDCSGHFKKPKVLWIGCQTVPQALYTLHRNLGEKISQCAYTPETRPYSPHMTVARKCKEVPGSIPFEPVHWQVNRFVLVESKSVSGAVSYGVVESYPLVS
jgi:2'-5' RNA ligase